MTRIVRPAELDGVMIEGEAACLPFAGRNSRVVVVEDGSGALIGKVGVYKVALIEGMWVAPEARKSLGVVRSLMGNAFSLASEDGQRWALVSTQSRDMDGYMYRLGAQEFYKGKRVYCLEVSR